MAKGTLKTNLPVSGSLAYVDYAPTSQPGKMEDQVKVTLLVDDKHVDNYPAGKTAFYLGLWAAQELDRLGCILTGEKDGKPVYNVRGTPRLSIHRTEDGTKKLTSITRLDAPAPTSAPPAAAPANGNGKDHSGPVAPPPSDAQAVMWSWWMLGEEYASAFLLAARAQSQVLDKPIEELDPAPVQAGAATILIQVEKRHLPSFPGLHKSVLAAVKKEQGE